MPFKVANHRKSDRIKVTHYVNPHEIWFKYDDSIELEEMLEIQETIEQLGIIRQRHFNHSPAVGEIVIVRYCFGSVNKFIRARVDFIYEYRLGSEFILWAIDEGYPIRSKNKWIMKLPPVCLQTDSPFVFKGTLNNVIPATLKCDTLDFKTQIVKTKIWSEKAINQIEKIISEAESLIFHYDCHAAQQHLFGSIEVISHTGKSFTLSEILRNLEEAMDCTANFEIEYQLLVHKNYWDQQNENYKIRQIGVDSIPHLDLEVPARKVTEIKKYQEISNKINDWDERCKRSLHMDDEECSVPHNKYYQIVTSTCKHDSENSNTDTSATSASPSVGISSSSSSSRKSINEPKSRPNFNFKKAIEQESSHRRKVLMHCSEGLLVQSISSIEQTHFSSGVCEELRYLQLKKLSRTQAVGWPHLMRGHSLILVNSTKTAKTRTYLPAVCSLIVEAHTELRILAGAGPVTIIICSNAAQAKRVIKKCQNFLKGDNLNEKFTCQAADGQSEDKDIQEHLLNGIDVLVTTVPCLLTLMKNPFLFNKNRITTIVFDDIVSMCNQFDVKNIELIYEEFCAEKKTQFIVTSKTWHKVLENFCQKSDVLLCIHTYIEAAIYSGVEIVIHTTNEDDHNAKFFSTLKAKNYAYESTIIVCNDSQEVLNVKDILRTEGICSVFCHDRSDLLKISSINNRMKTNQKDDLDVLVCTDDVLLDLNIRHAQHILHYSLPADWTTFTHRFGASFEYYENLVQDGLSAGRPTSLIFGDVTKLPKSFTKLAQVY